MPGIGKGISPFLRKGKEPTFDPDAQLYFDESATSLSPAFKSAVSWFFEDLKSTNNYTKISYAIWAAGPDQTLARTSLVEPSRKATEVVSSGWSADEWWAGNGSRYLDLNWNPTANGGAIYTRNNAGFTILTMQAGLYSGGELLFGARGTPAGTGDTLLLFSSPNTFCAVNDDLKAGTVSKTMGLNGATRINSTQITLNRNGAANGTVASTSDPLLNINFAGLAWNNNGTFGAPSNNKITLIMTHSGDIDVSALANSVHGLIGRLNGGFKVTELNLNISGMPAGDSSLLTTDGTKLFCIGGYVPGDPNNASNRVFTSPDGITWTARTSMPFRSAHSLGGLRADGNIWVFGQASDTGKMVCYKVNPTTYAWTAVNTDLNASGQSFNGHSYLQWGGILANDEMFWAVTNDSGATVKIFVSSDGNTWTHRSTFPVGYATNSAWYQDGSTIRVAGGCRNPEPSPMDNFVTNIYESTDNLATWSMVRSIPTKLYSAWPLFFKYDGSEFFITGRNTASTIYEGGVYRYNGTDWINTLLPNFNGRHAQAGCHFGGDFYLVNGYLYNDCHKLTTI